MSMIYDSHTRPSHAAHNEMWEYHVRSAVWQPFTFKFLDFWDNRSQEHFTQIPCFRYGHLARDCQEEEDRCYRCHGTGHIARNCEQEEDTCYNCNKVVAWDFF